MTFKSSSLGLLFKTKLDAIPAIATIRTTITKTYALASINNNYNHHNNNNETTITNQKHSTSTSDEPVTATTI
jgi:hypothetical protein